jgi:hypothetical protein
MYFVVRAFFAIAVLLFSGLATLCAQSEPETEPPLATDRRATSPYSKNYRIGGAINIVLSNFGFSFGGQLEQAVSSNTSLYLAGYITGLRDVSEQTFQNVFGQQFIPNKYRRIISFPVLIGVKQRLFPEKLDDSFRFHFHMAGGIVPSFVYPYFLDSNGDGIWNQATVNDPYQELIYDPLQGWGEGSWKTGLSGEFGVGVDFGKDFDAVSGVFFGAVIHYFHSGIQVLEPNRLAYGPGGQVSIVPNVGPRKFFVSPVIRFSFGKYWKTGK